MLKTSYFKYILLFIACILFQVLIFNNIVLDFFAYAVPIVYIYFILKLPFNANFYVVVVLGFLLGVIIDIFCNTLGINAAATTFVAFLRYHVLKIFIVDHQEEFIDTIPSIRIFGLSIFLKYAFTILSLHILLIILFEHFDSIQWTQMLPKFFYSIIISILIILAIDKLFDNNN